MEKQRKFIAEASSRLRSLGPGIQCIHNIEWLDCDVICKCGHFHREHVLPHNYHQKVNTCLVCFNCPEFTEVFNGTQAGGRQGFGKESDCD